MAATRASLTVQLLYSRADLAHNLGLEDAAIEGLDGLDFGDRCYYGDRVRQAQDEIEAIEAALAALPADPAFEAELARLQAASVEDLADGYSDCYKSVYAYRPRHTPTHLELVCFWLTYSEDFARVEAEEAEQLADLGFATWTAYYDHLEAEDWREYEAARIEAEEAEAHRLAYLTRDHALPVIEAWECGALL